jgi:AcrR family transcriptional regulator
MRNAVPAAPSPAVADPVARAVASRGVERRQEAYATEVRRLLDAAFAVMRETGELDPRVGDIVRTSGLSNQAFYRHFESKDALLLGVLEDGQRQLVDYLEHRMATVGPGLPRIRRWIEGVLEQARNAEAAARTRPFALHAARLRDRFPTETGRATDLVVAPLRDAIGDAGGDPVRDADAVYQLTMGTMHAHLVARTHPDARDVAHVVRFALAGIAGGDGA